MSSAKICMKCGKKFYIFEDAYLFVRDEMCPQCHQKEYGGI